MLTSAIAILALGGGHLSPQQPEAKDLLAKMMARYHDAKTLVGKIHLTVSAQNQSVSMDTVVQFELPSKVYIKQQKNVANPDPDQPNTWLVTSDGRNFTYDAPIVANSLGHTTRGTRLGESVFNATYNITNDVRSIYLAAGKSLGDRSMPLDVAIGRKEDLVYRRNQWVDYNVTGQKEVNGKTAYIVSGNYRDYASAPSTGVYQIVLTAEGDILQYVEKTKIALDSQGSQVVTLTNQWDVDLTVNGKVDPLLFKVVI